ncbi:hypothetical protein TMCBR3_gp052 [Caulobacter phage TMCBR3]|nr:hypothetical protein TMCBR3_gp052 [Caulobacter phage TMCBR3]
MIRKGIKSSPRRGIFAALRHGRAAWLPKMALEQVGGEQEHAHQA